MSLIFLAFAICVLWECRFYKSDWNAEYLSPERSKSFRGILAIVVVCYHLAQKTGDRSLFHLFVYCGFLAVAYFFFLSGYGLQRSFASKPGYRRTILRKRIPSIFIPYLLFLVLYWGLRWFEGAYIQPLEVLRSIFTKKQIVSYSWYTRCLLLAYLGYWLSTAALKGNSLWIPAVNLLFTLFYTYRVRALGYSGFWYNACITFPLGIVWAVLEDKWLPFIRKHYYGFTAAVFAGFGVFFVAVMRFSIGKTVLPLYWPCCVLFVLAVLLLQQKVAFGNRVLSLLGECSLEIYMFHGFFIKLYRGNHIYIEEPFLWVLAVLASSIAGSWMIHQLLRKLLKRQ